MMFLVSIGLIFVSLLLITLWTTYGRSLPLELKRRARLGDSRAAQLYQAVAYGPALTVLLLGLIGVGSAAAVVIMVRQVMPVFALPIVAVFLWLGFVWLPRHSFRRSAVLASWLAPLLAKITSYLYPLISLVPAWRAGQLHTAAASDIYETEDLLAMLEKQKLAAHNRIPQHDLEAAARVLSLAHHHAQDVMVAKDEATLVAVNDLLGPLLLDELHESGASSFMVYDGKRDNLVGTLALHDALRAPAGARARDVMHAPVCFINETQNLEDILQAFHTTHQHVFAVVNRANDFMGIVTIEGLLRGVLGTTAAEDSLVYEDRSAMARYQPAIRLEPVTEPVEEQPDEQPQEIDEPNLSISESSQGSETLPPQPPEVVE